MTGPWRVELRAGVLWRVVKGTEVWGTNKVCTQAEAEAVCRALNRFGDARQPRSSEDRPQPNDQ